MVFGRTATVWAHSPLLPSPAGVTVIAELPLRAVALSTASPGAHCQPGIEPGSARGSAGISKPGLVARLGVAACAAGVATLRAMSAVPAAQAAIRRRVVDTGDSSVGETHTLD